MSSCGHSAPQSARFGTTSIRTDVLYFFIPRRRSRSPHSCLLLAFTGAKVHAEVLEHYRADKVIVFKMKAKKHYRRKTVRERHHMFRSSGAA